MPWSTVYTEHSGGDFIVLWVTHSLCTPLWALILAFLLCIVVCAEDKIWMTVQHNNTELTRVQGFNSEKPYAMTLNYGGSMEQLEALIDGSEHCEQEVAYHCRRSRLLNTPGKFLPFMVTWNSEANILIVLSLIQDRVIEKLGTSI